jgi:hypothetical protein
MQARTLDRRLLLGIVLIFVALVALVLVIGRGNIPLFGTAGTPPIVDAAYTALSAQLGRSVGPTNSTYTWTLGPYPDTSLGCPQNGQTYPQTQTNGYSVVINYQGAIYDYRAKSDGAGLFLCSTGGTVVRASGNTSDTSNGNQITEPVALVDAVYGDLNRRFGTQLSRANSRYYYFYTTYPDNSLGCPQNGRTYTEGVIWGWQILVTPGAGGSYDYRGFDATNFWACN